ncbi:MAG TPA: hypothetical protein VF782_00160 [Allosphingosinicella sp.]|jgi:hypothetical protein
MSPHDQLSILSVAGVAVTLGGLLLSQLTKTSVDGEGNRKVLTPTGRVALAIAVAGVLGSFASEGLKASIRWQADRDAAIKTQIEEQRRLDNDAWKSRSEQLAKAIFGNTKTQLDQTEINLRKMIDGFSANQQSIFRTQLAVVEARQRVLADNLIREARLYGRLSATGSPLFRMTIELQIDQAPPALLATVRNGLRHARDFFENEAYVDLNVHHNIDGKDDAAMARRELYGRAVQPVLSWLANGEIESRQAIMLVSLDDQFSAVSAIGWADGPLLGDEDSSILYNGESDLFWLPTGILSGDLTWAAGRGAGDQSQYPAVNVSTAGSSIRLAIDIGPAALDRAITRYSKASATTATLPDELFVMFWSPMPPGETGSNSDPPKLPFDSKGVHDVVGYIAKGGRSRSTSPLTSWGRPLRIRLIPNGVNPIGKTYRLKPAGNGELYDGIRDDEYGGYLRVWRGMAQ